MVRFPKTHVAQYPLVIAPYALRSPFQSRCSATTSKHSRSIKRFRKNDCRFRSRSLSSTTFPISVFGSVKRNEISNSFPTKNILFRVSLAMRFAFTYQSSARICVPRAYNLSQPIVSLYRHGYQCHSSNHCLEMANDSGNVSRVSSNSCRLFRFSSASHDVC